MEQTYAGEIEVVIVFDQSEPHPIEVDVPAGRTLTVIRNTERNPGLAGARNTGVLATSGDVGRLLRRRRRVAAREARPAR